MTRLSQRQEVTSVEEPSESSNPVSSGEPSTLPSGAPTESTARDPVDDSSLRVSDGDQKKIFSLRILDPRRKSYYQSVSQTQSKMVRELSSLSESEKTEVHDRLKGVMGRLRQFDSRPGELSLRGWTVLGCVAVFVFVPWLLL